MADKYIWTKDSIPEIDVHSVKKHDVLREYLKQYILIVGGFPIQRKTLKITFIDAFSGGGIYEIPGGGVRHGSPLVFLTATKEAAFRLSQEKPFELKPNYIFLEKKKNNISFLRSLLGQEGYGREIDKTIFLKQGLFNQNVEYLIKHICRRKGPARRCIFFLDQYGYSDVPLLSINRIFSNLPNAEIILTFNVGFLVDYMTDSKTCQKSLDKTNLSFDLSLLDGIKELKDWRSIIQRMLYKDIIKKSGARYFTNFFIKSNESRKSYWLLHLSMHPTARNEMQKLHWSLKNHFCHEGKPGLFMLGYNPEMDGFGQRQDFLFSGIDEEINHKTLLEEIPGAIPGCGITFSDFVNAQCNYTPSTSEMLNKAIMELYSHQELRIFTPNGSLKRPGSLIKKNDIIKREPQRSLFDFKK